MNILVFEGGVFKVHNVDHTAQLTRTQASQQRYCTENFLHSHAHMDSCPETAQKSFHRIHVSEASPSEQLRCGLSCFVVSRAECAALCESMLERKVLRVQI